MIRNVYLATAVLALALSTGCQERSASSTTVDLSYVPPNTMGVVMARPGRILTDDFISKHDLHEAVQNFDKELGFDVKNCEQVLALFQMPDKEDPSSDPIPSVAARLKSPIDEAATAEKILKQTPESKEVDGKKYFYKPANSPTSKQPNAVAFPDPTTILIGKEATVKQMLSAHNQNDALTKLLKKVDESDDVAFLFVSNDETRKLAKEAADPRQLGPFAGFAELPQLIDTVCVTCRTKPEVSAEIELTGKDEESATKIKNLAQGAQGMAQGFLQMAKAQQSAQAPSQNPEAAAMQSQMMELGEKVINGMTPKQSGSVVTINLEKLGTLDSLAAPFVKPLHQAREAARGTTSSNNLKEIGLALANYADANKHFPAQAIKSVDGKPLLSWRVAILPYLEESALYGKFKLDEPWDSPHNIELIKQIPRPYIIPGSESAAEGKTRYLGVTGKSSFFDPEKELKIGQFIDGTSKTIAVVEVGEDKAVPWTKPDDFEVDLSDPTKGLGDVDAIAALFVDCHVERLRKTIKPEILKAMLTRNGGEIWDPDEVE